MQTFEIKNDRKVADDRRDFQGMKLPPATIETTMLAIRLHAPGGPTNLEYEQIDTPRPGTGEALVRIYAAAITRDELKWPVARLPAIPSYEFSGIVVALGSEADDLKIGDAVYALSGFDHDGAAAEYAVVPKQFLAPKPRTLDHIECAAIPLAALAAWQGLFDHGGLQKGQRVLIHGAAGGVGSYAVQLAHHHGAHVVGTASANNVQTVRDLGADQVIDHTRSRFEDAIEPVDLVFDTVGGDRLRRSPAVLRAGGHRSRRMGEASLAA
ncbi:MAG: NADP-dependent oxidoreductase, partial [Opitutaceae bacterium]